jgi:protein-L-isoaspartate(D-aspartate) O-methyltransferase
MSLDGLGLNKKSVGVLATVLVCLALISVFLMLSSSAGTAKPAAENQAGDANVAEPNPQGNSHEEQKQSKPEKTHPPVPAPVVKRQAGRPTHNHPAFGQRKKERDQMVTNQIERRDVSDRDVLKAMRTVPRHAFVLKQDLRRAYRDHPLPIGLGQTISQPYIVAYMTEALNLEPNSIVLEIGTGSGYQAAVCAEIAGEVFTIEILEKLAESAKQRLAELGYQNVYVKAADGYFGWPQHGPFDAIIITAAAGIIPPPLIEQLRPGGRMILPLGSPFGAQTLVLVTKDAEGGVHTRRLLAVRFVPMTGKVAEGKGRRGK